MIIRWAGGENFNIKTKNLTCQIGQEKKLGELEIGGPGEYEVGGVQLEVIDGIVEIFAEGITVGHIKKGKLMSDEELEKLNGIDILIIGTGGKDFTETKTAAEVISQIDPSVVIPMGDNVEEFIREEQVSAAAQDEFKIAKGDLPQDSRRVVVLNARG